jgi:hypothetical protein
VAVFDFVPQAVAGSRRDKHGNRDCSVADRSARRPIEHGGRRAIECARQQVDGRGCIAKIDAADSGPFRQSVRHEMAAKLPQSRSETATGNWNWQLLFAALLQVSTQGIIQSIKILGKKILFDFRLLRCQNLYGNATNTFW